jgi:hypothetical protein
MASHMAVGMGMQEEVVVAIMGDTAMSLLTQRTTAVSRSLVDTL